jgi:hypothetical protein
MMMMMIIIIIIIIINDKDMWVTHITSPVDVLPPTVHANTDRASKKALVIVNIF